MHHILMPFKYLDACRTRNAFLFKIKVNFFFFFPKKRAIYLERKRSTPMGEAVSGTIAIYREGLQDFGRTWRVLGSQREEG